jgi:hypothetical protein
MIHYQLQCSQSHAFDGWFQDSAGFERQAARGLLECPICGDVKVERALMAPALPRKANALPAPAAPTPPPEKATPVAVAGSPGVSAPVPAQVRAMLQKLREAVEQHCDYVGETFAEEARRIHRGETEARGIYGEASPEEAEALADEGIDIASIPWVPRADG